MFTTVLKSRMQPSDVVFVQGLQRHDVTMEAMFYKECQRYFDKVYHTIFSNRRVKDDIFQESFVKLWMEITDGTIVVHGEKLCRRDADGVWKAMTCSLSTFLMGIARHNYNEWMRHDNLVLADNMEGEVVAVVQVGCGMNPQEEAKQRIINDCIMKLPQRCKEILTLFYYEKLSLDEIMNRRCENVSKNGLKTGKHKCMSRLKEDAISEFDRLNLKPYTHVCHG